MTENSIKRKLTAILCADVPEDRKMRFRHHLANQKVNHF